MNPVRETLARQEALASFEAAYQRAVAENNYNGPLYRIVPLNGGYSLEEQVIKLDGSLAWKQVDWNRYRDNVLNSFSRRGGRLQG